MNEKITKKNILDEFNNDFDHQSMDPDTKLSEASLELKNDRDIMLAAVERNGSLYEYIGDSLRDDKQIALTALNQRKKVLDEFGDLMDWDCELYLNICEKFDKSLWKDKDVVLLVLELYGHHIVDKEFIDKSLLKDPDILKAADKNKI